MFLIDEVSFWIKKLLFLAINPPPPISLLLLLLHLAISMNSNGDTGSRVSIYDKTNES